MQNNYTGLFEVNPFPLFCCHFLVLSISLPLLNYSVIHQVAHTHTKTQIDFTHQICLTIHFFLAPTLFVTKESKSKTPARFHRGNNKNILLWRLSNKNNCRRINILIRRSKPVSVSLGVCAFWHSGVFFSFVSSLSPVSLSIDDKEKTVQHFIADQSGSVMSRELNVTIDGASGAGRCLVLNLKKKKENFRCSLLRKIAIMTRQTVVYEKNGIYGWIFWRKHFYQTDTTSKLIKKC